MCPWAVAPSHSSVRTQHQPFAGSTIHLHGIKRKAPLLMLDPDSFSPIPLGSAAHGQMGKRANMLPPLVPTGSSNHINPSHIQEPSRTPSPSPKEDQSHPLPHLTWPSLQTAHEPCPLQRNVPVAVCGHDQLYFGHIGTCVSSVPYQYKIPGQELSSLPTGDTRSSKKKLHNQLPRPSSQP